MLSRQTKKKETSYFERISIHSLNLLIQLYGSKIGPEIKFFKEKININYYFVNIFFENLVKYHLL